VGDVHIPQPEPGAVGAKVDELIAAGHEFYATAVTGSPSGRVRRPTLFIIAGVGIVLAMLGFALGGVWAIIAIIALALTDQVVEL
jgi:hypothetical protein